MNFAHAGPGRKTTKRTFKFNLIGGGNENLGKIGIGASGTP
jgi:hypothetical protein